MTGHTPSEISTILRGMDEVLIEESKRREATAPRCHMMRMISNCGDNDEWWWECSVCGHTKNG